MAGFENGICVCDNLNFNLAGAKPHTGIINAAGKLPIGTGQTAPTPEILGGSLTSPLGTLSIGYSSPNITIDLAGGAFAVEHLTGNTGGQLNPTANNFNTLGTGSITIAGSGSTLTTQLTGLTNHAVLIGAGTATITNVGPVASTGAMLQSNGVGSDPGFSTSTWPATTTVSQILYSSSTNTVAGLATANRAVLTTGTTGIPVLTALATDGQIIIGSTAGAPAAASITSSNSSITITPGSNTISLTTGTAVPILFTANTGTATPSSGNLNVLGGGGIQTAGSGATLTIAVATGGFTWSDTSGTVTAAIQNGYFITTTCTSTLPASPSEGDTVKYIVDTTNLLTITGNTGQKIRIGTTLSAAAGTAVNTQRGDAITLVYRTSGTTWFAEGNPVGGWNVT